MSLFSRFKDWFHGVQPVTHTTEQSLVDSWSKRRAELGDWKPSNGWAAEKPVKKAEVFKIENPRYELLKRRRAKLRAGR